MAAVALVLHEKAFAPLNSICIGGMGAQAEQREHTGNH
jgi:hypothetical protein